MIHTEDKPPLTRRWTVCWLFLFEVRGQTSAHAEMDPATQGFQALLLPNLRSRGDGPLLSPSTTFTSTKPPLTRRWTLIKVYIKQQNTQTSAHAEMDPSCRHFSRASQANLRSRGDGPSLLPRRCVFSSQVRAKPPLTRRWTRLTISTTASRTQTSAHAEMDLCSLPRRHVAGANLRSRGDGPLVFGLVSASLTKPPLTRRWTSWPR